MAIAIQKYRARYQWKRYSIIRDSSLTYTIETETIDVTTPPYDNGFACKSYNVALDTGGRFYYFQPMNSVTNTMKSWHSNNIALLNSGYTPSTVPLKYFRPKVLTAIVRFTGESDKYGRLYASRLMVTTKSVPGEPSKGDFIDIVASPNPLAYPNNGISGDYWYVRI